MNPISLKINQFTNPDAIVDAVDGDIIGPTVSICHHCHQHIPAYKYHKNNQLWMIKRCRLHGDSSHLLESDYNFLLTLSHNTKYKANNAVLIEVSDRCNAECPHCYHMPDNNTIDKPISEVLTEIEKFYVPDSQLCLTGAEASLRKDFPKLISTIANTFEYKGGFGTMTNGIKFANMDFLKRCRDAGLHAILVGLNHPSYLNNSRIRRKQLKALDNAIEIGMSLGYIGYTMSSILELEDILEETTNTHWLPKGQYKIRYGADIGRYPNQQKMYVSDIFKITKAWCERNNKSFEIIPDADNNLHHVMVNIEGQQYRLIRWCDEEDIDMEALRVGPWANFVAPDGVTNFLHQIIRRDIWKNKNLPLTDVTPARYHFANRYDKSVLDFNTL